MALRELAAGNYVVLAPQEPLISGGPAEECEQRAQVLFKEGHLYVIVDLANVLYMDSVGVRALIRGYTTAQRLGGRFKLAAPTARVRKLLRVTRLDTVFDLSDSLEAAQRDEPAGGQNTP